MKGSFTGAIANKKGLFEAAHSGTFFLDEIGEMPATMQVRLLRVLQEGTFTPVGSTEQRKVDVRVIAATNRNLREMVDAGTFREDLYYRLNVINIRVPPLRERKEDIPLLAEHFLVKESEKGGPKKMLTKRALEKLYDYVWPGNVRELQNVVERCVVLAEGDEITLDLLPPAMRGGRPPVSLPGRGGDLDSLARDLVEQGMATAGPDDAAHQHMTVFALGLGVAGIASPREAVAADLPAPTAWEYKWVDVRIWNRGTALNEAGVDGWELVTIVENTQAVMKRPKR
jgi:DNA-binding NtrC family response regulator